MTVTVCRIDGCGKIRLAQGLCTAHYKRMKRHGDPLAGGIERGAPLKWLESTAMTSDTDLCVDWPYGRCAGYGSVRFNGKPDYAHRIICEKTHGPSPTGRFEAAHACGNSLCCNPRHLRWATPSENAADKKIHGTMPVGEKASNHKLKEIDVLEMRRLRKQGASYQSIASKFDHDIGGTRRAIIGETWAHLPL